MEVLTEYAQIKKSLAAIRKIQEDFGYEYTNKQPNSDYFSNHPATDPGYSSQGTEVTQKTGEKVQFDSINTIGFLNSGSNLPNKQQIIQSIGNFLKGTGLILTTVNINIEDGRVILKTDSIKNPGMEIVKSISFDTEQESPQLQIVGGVLNLTPDFTSLIQGISSTYNDPKIGREFMIQSFQSNSNLTT